MSQALAATTAPDPQSLTFAVHGRTLAAKAWGSAEGRPCIALHGWLDNANTFDRIAPALPELRLVALDFAGHGFSSHRGPGEHYTSLADVQDVIAVANALGWTEFDLIGHSMGAAVATEIAGLFPERVSRAVMIDGFAHHEGDARAAILANREAIGQMLAAHRAPRVFTAVDDMIERVVAVTDQSRAAAATLVARGHRLARGGYTWRTDPRIRFRTPNRMTDDQLDALMQGSTTPSLLIVANQGDRWYQPGIPRRQQHHQRLEVVRMDGPHHLHLEEAQAPLVVALIRGFLSLD
jgi:pimeloyl-ACP methyl ester carboxylesterase